MTTLYQQWMNFYQQLMAWMDLNVLVLAGLCTLIFSARIWWVQRQQGLLDRQEIYILLRNEATADVRKISGYVQRKDLTRSEIRGIISMDSQDPRGHFSIETFNNENFYRELNRLKNQQQKRTLCLNLTAEEARQFPMQTLQSWPDYCQQHQLLGPEVSCVSDAAVAD